jgi:hypothetical protein
LAYKIGIVDSFDPDNDGFIFGLPQARELHCNVNLLHFLRRKIIASKMKCFDQALPTLELRLKDHRHKLELQLPPEWTVAKHDRSLLKHVCDRGLLVTDISEWIQNSVDFASKPTAELLFERIKQLCDLFS